MESQARYKNRVAKAYSRVFNRAERMADKAFGVKSDKLSEVTRKQLTPRELMKTRVHIKKAQLIKNKLNHG